MMSPLVVPPTRTPIYPCGFNMGFEPSNRSNKLNYMGIISKEYHFDPLDLITNLHRKAGPDEEFNEIPRSRRPPHLPTPVMS